MHCFIWILSSSAKTNCAENCAINTVNHHAEHYEFEQEQKLKDTPLQKNQDQKYLTNIFKN